MRAAGKGPPFTAPGLLDRLCTMGDAALDMLGFGVVGMDQRGRVVAYNAVEERMAGLRRDTVLGDDLFHSVAPCMNNVMVSRRFEGHGRLDKTLDHVLTVRMRPTRVILRLLKAPGRDRRFVAILRA